VVAFFADALAVAWDPQGNLWLTTKRGQLLRRPVQKLPDGRGAPFGPPEERSLPQPLEPGGEHVPAWIRPDGQLLAVYTVRPSARVRMFQMDGGARLLWTRDVPYLLYGAADAHGRWLAPFTQDGGRGIPIVEAHSGKLVKELLIGDAYAAFSPDGRWLVATTGRLTSPEGECGLWRTDTWEKVCAQPLRRSSTSPAPVAISPDGAVVAVAYTMSEVKLLRLETLAEIATLTAPEPGIVMGMQFSPDGRQLFVTVANTVHVWDLHALRRGLRAVGLDWDRAP
jgi:WD40 repeat protein